MTNHHVIPDVADAMDMIAEFDFELLPSLAVGNPSSFRLVAQKFFLTSSLGAGSECTQFRVGLYHYWY